LTKNKEHTQNKHITTTQERMTIRTNNYLFYLNSFLLIFISSCSGNEIPTSESKYVEPYSVEYFEIKKIKNDTSIIIYFNREVDERDVPLRINPIYKTDSIHNLQTFMLVLPLTKSKNNILKINYPIKENSRLLKHNSKESIEQFNNQLRLEISGKNPYAYVNLIPDFPNCPNNRILANGQRLYWISDIIEFSPKKERTKFNIEDISKGIEWRKDFWRYYEGKMDSNGNKIGQWKWKYSNGNTLATVSFKQDTISSILNIYSFKGELIESIPANDKRLYGDY
jgi:hypothetical protein